jgi:hypothetical protein
MYVFAEHHNFLFSFFIFTDSIHLFILTLKDEIFIKIIYLPGKKLLMT